MERTEGWRESRNEEPRILNCSPWTGYVTRLRETEKCIENCCRDCEGKSPLGIPRGRWEDNMKYIFGRNGV
jgi:hypothetical protein